MSEATSSSSSPNSVLLSNAILNPMTKVQKTFSVTRPLTESDLLNIARMHSVYGFLAVRWKPEGNELFVEYDASRLALGDVRVSLEEHGLPVSTNVPAS